ncbi:MAG: DNA double-strand break repair nuclease NurA [Methanobrevibacter sp.]|jgi:NurA-like 5'-3' nuclease|nr:DNA double-strand break repair nuclease NurA [Candidatus Methanoflexus mossambicus]
MLDSLYLKAIERKDYFLEQIEDLETSNLNIKEKWHNVNFKDLSSNLNDNLTIAAGDGSKHEKNFLGYIFYAIAAQSLVYDKNSLEKIESSDIDLIYNRNLASDRIRNYMGIFEVKNAIKTFKTFDIDYYLYDGSILGDLIRPVPLVSFIKDDLKSEIIHIGNNDLKELLDERLAKNLDIVAIESNKIFDIDFKCEDPKFTDYKTQIFLEFLENLLSIAKLLEFKWKIVGISKTSKTNDLFHSRIPDMAILDKFIKTPGYSKPIYKKVSNEVKHDFYTEDDFFKKQWFTIFFLRLERNKNILKVELPYYADEDKIKQIATILYRDATEGYPYLLKKAHNDVVITDKDMNQLINIIGFKEKSGREMLD